MKAIAILLVVCTASIISLFVLDVLSGRPAQSSDCRPHLYMSGEVEIRGAGEDRYVVIYRDLDELARMLRVVEQDRRGEIRWMGTE